MVESKQMTTKGISTDSETSQVPLQLVENEHVLMSCDIQKQNRFGFWQKRQLQLTSYRLLNLNGNFVNRSIPLSKIQALTKSTLANNHNFIIHIEDDYDSVFKCEDRDELIESIRKCYQEKHNQDLQIFGIQGKIEQFVTPKQGTVIDVRKAKGTLPPDEYLINEQKEIGSNRSQTEFQKAKELTIQLTSEVSSDSEEIDSQVLK